MELKAKVEGQMAEILTPEALAFVEKLVREFEPTRAKLLARRVGRQKEIDNGAMPDFLKFGDCYRRPRFGRIGSFGKGCCPTFCFVKHIIGLFSRP